MFSSDQLEVIETAKDLFSNYAEEKIVNTYFSQPIYQQLATQLTQELIEDIEWILDQCLNNQFDEYSRDAPQSMSALMWKIETYKELLFALRDFSVQTSLEDDFVSEWMLILQDHIIDDLWEQLADNVFLEKISNMRFAMEFASQENSFWVDVDLTSQWVWNVAWTLADGNVSIDAEVNVEEWSQNIQVDGETDMDIRVVDNRVFLKFNNTNLSITDWSLDSNELQELKQFNESMKLIQWKWLDILWFNSFQWTNATLYSMSNLELLSMYGNIANILAEYPWLMTYEQDGAVYYAGINPAVCLVAESESNVTWCLEDLWLENRVWTQWKWFVVFDGNLAEYNIQLTDKFMLESVPQEMKFMFDTRLLSWWRDKINYLHIPFGERWEITYDEKEINWSIVFPQTTFVEDGDTQEWVTYDVLVWISWEYDEDKLDIDVSVNSKYLQGVANLQNEWNLKNQLFTMDGFFYDMTQDWFEVSYNLVVDTSQTETEAVSVDVPAEEDVVDMSVFGL